MVRILLHHFFASAHKHLLRIPLERGREVAVRYGVAPLLSPLFDFIPTTNSLVPLSSGMPHTATSPRPLSASSSFSSLGNSGGYMPSNLGPAPIMPGSALRLLNQGRAQGLFTPSTSASHPSRTGNYSPGPPYFTGYPYVTSHSPTLPTSQSLKRSRSELDADAPTTSRTATPLLPTQSQEPRQNSSSDIRISDGSRPPSATPAPVNSEDSPSPTKKARKEAPPLHTESSGLPGRATTTNGFPRNGTVTPPINGLYYLLWSTPRIILL